MPKVKLDAAQVFHWTDATGAEPRLDFGKTPVLRYMYKPLDTSSKEKRLETMKVYYHL